ncbi:hypothetical protein V5O48_005939 [Marasmius crinis-equi]|uniref:RRM domain-containing protein n=1 Tax=Marasmius crinis-equi TaxID=585013 RepID=A0ABR3FLH7_9AGAR
MLLLRLSANRKALCMSGYTIGGCSLGEFAAIFSRYGTVTHCVVLATVDNASRRRGFVVMSSHEEAKRAMMALTRTQIKGHTIDISWSIVQRSQGFLDGGDRTNLFDACVNSPTDDVQPDNHPRMAPSVDLHSLQTENSFTLVFVPSTALLVTNLPFILFSQTSDLQPLLCPFGEVKTLQMINLPSPQETTSALVEYTEITSAQEAKEYLQGQCYANYRINAEYACLSASMTPQIPATSEFNVNDYERTYPRHDHIGSTQRSTSTVLGPSRCSQLAFGGQGPHAKRPLQDISNASYYMPHSATPSTFPTFSNKPPVSRTGSANSK